MVVLGLAVGTYLFRLAGLTLLAGRTLPPTVDELLRLLPAALIAGLITSQTFGDGSTLVIDARLVGALTAVVAVALKAPFLVVLLSALAMTAASRAIGLG